MSDNQDPLSQLWQRQDVVQPDLTLVSKKWRKVRLKQRCYVLLDCLSLVIPSAIIWYKADEIDSFTMTLVLFVMSLSVLAVIYITWLRRFSLGWSNVSTDQYIQQLQKQIQSNIKIANLSLHSVWLMVLVFIVFFGSLYHFDVFPIDKLMRKIWVTGAINAVALPGIWIWAMKRKKRFVQELAELTQLLKGTKS